MDDLTAARAQMELSLGFHMIFAAAGVAAPTLMLIAEWRWLRTGVASYARLARTWAKASAVLFAIGAVSGTALSFELGLLWPTFMAFAGPLFGLAFALEGYAFFVEAIFLGLYLYGWERLRPRAHWLCGVPVALGGTASALLVLSANAWMQHPVGFTLVDGKPTNVDPLAALFNPSWPAMALHATSACFAAVGFAVAGIYAWALLHDPRSTRASYNRQGLVIAIMVGGLGALIQPISGDVLARRAHELQPAKLAAAEGLFRTQRGAPLSIGGWPDLETRETRFAIDAPALLSLLATHDPNAEVLGLEAFPRDQWPDPRVVHLAFDLMVGAGTAMLAVAAIWAGLWWRGRHDDRWAERRPLLWLLVLASPLGFLALEAGWVVTEAGRQPWVIYGVMRTSEAVTPAPGVGWSLAGFTLLYLVLTGTLLWILRRLARGEDHESREAAEPRLAPA